MVAYLNEVDHKLKLKHMTMTHSGCSEIDAAPRVLLEIISRPMVIEADVEFDDPAVDGNC